MGQEERGSFTYGSRRKREEEKPPIEASKSARLQYISSRDRTDGSTATLYVLPRTSTGKWLAFRVHITC